MKNLVILLIIAIVLGSCSSLKEVGQVNMISSRNIDSNTQYVLLKTGTNNSKVRFKKIKAETIDHAINNTVADVPGGEFLKNAKLYTDGNMWAVVGDVWGVSENANIEGFRVGDLVLIKNSILKKENFSKGEITGFKDRKTCIVKVNDGTMKEIDYSDLSKASN